jgi:Arc/MetJ-type ribon-helix-helix transcriptional regulator
VTIDIKPEVKAAIDKRLQNGAFHDVDELLTKALAALPENGERHTSPKPRKRLIDILTSPPFAGSRIAD